MRFCHCIFRLTFPIKSRDQIHNWNAGGALPGRFIAVSADLSFHQNCPAIPQAVPRLWTCRSSRCMYRYFASGGPWSGPRRGLPGRVLHG